MLFSIDMHDRLKIRNCYDNFIIFLITELIIFFPVKYYWFTFADMPNPMHNLFYPTLEYQA